MSSFGQELRREREVRRISLREIAEATKINARHLEALENNDFDHLPGGLYNRGFVREYCKFIGADAEAMVNAYLLEEQAQAEGRHSTGGLLRGRSEPPAAPSPAVRIWRSGRWALGLLLLLVLLALVLAGYLWLRSAGNRASAGGPTARLESGSTRSSEVRG